MSKIDYAEESGKLKGPKEKKKSVRKVKKCMYTGCPLNASTEFGGNYRCSFHFSGDFHHEVTMAIIENLNFIKAYSKMVKWRVSDWTEHSKWLLTKKNCPMEPKELPSVYISRSFEWLSEKIKDDATRHIENR
jgi:hypothetical protein